MRTRDIAVAIFRKIKSATTSIKFLPYLSNCRYASYLWYRSKIMPVSWNPHQIKGKKCIEDMIENISFRRELLFWPCFNKTYIFHLRIPISEWMNFPQTSFGLYVSDLISFLPSYSPCIAGQCLPCTCVTMPDKLVQCVVGVFCKLFLNQNGWQSRHSTWNHVAMSHCAEIYVHVSNLNSP